MENIENCQCHNCKQHMHSSDCAVHNEPAYPAGKCDCEYGVVYEQGKSDACKLISVEDELPPSGQRVIFYWKNSLGNAKISMGFYAAEKNSISYYLESGWFEESADNEYFIPIECLVTHWMPPLPKAPEKGNW